MIRFVRTPAGSLRVDEVKQINGRGLYLCPTMMCYKKVQKKNRMDPLSGIEQLKLSSNDGWPRGKSESVYRRKGNGED
ncbi:MAG: YlxR family protein [Desulfobacterales bacterium]|jgi:hypothetical protein|nr:YlxR family protein [Desulfobacterales bacterium]